MKKILAHTSGNRQYRSLLRQLSVLDKNAVSIHATNLHNNIFDTTYLYKPDILLYPMIEYTQEIHNYIENYHNKQKIILYIDMILDNTDLIRYLSHTDCLFIVKNNTTKIDSNKIIPFDYLYDDNLYFRLPNTSRNNKIAVSLSNDNIKNKNILESYVYPNKCEYPIVLFNNPEFKHPQNIGTYNEPDLNYVLNTYGYFIDIDREFELEAAATNIAWLSGEDNFIETIRNGTWFNRFQELYTQYAVTNFAKKQLLPFLGL